MRGCFRSIINIQAWGKLKLDFNFPHAFFEIKNLKHISFFTLSLCCRTVLIALRETCIFTTARAATFVAAKAARVPHGRAAVVRRRRSLTNGDSRDKACIHGWLACAFVKLRFPRLRSARHCFRSSPPSMPHYHAAGGRRSIARYARASGGQGYVQHGFTTQRTLSST